MERGFWIIITIVLSMPIWLLMYDELVPNVINETNTVYIEPELDCAECIEICHGTTYDELAKDITEEMKEQHPDLWSDMAPKYFDDVVQNEGATSFSDAFKAARAELGSGHTFEWSNSMYTTNYKEELEVANQSID